MEITWRVISGGGGREWENGMGNKKHKRYKTDRGKLRIVWKMEKPKNLYI